jgi:hypothetical protein
MEATTSSLPQKWKEKSMTNFKPLGLLGLGLIIASMASAAMASEHHTRHHRIYASERVRNALGFERPSAAGPENQSAFGTVFPWKSGMQPDDWRQSVNGD